MEAAVWLNHVLLAGLVYPWADTSLRQRDLPRYVADVLYAGMLSMLPWLVHGLNYTALAAMWLTLMSWNSIEAFMGNWKSHTLADVRAWPWSLVAASLLAVAILAIVIARGQLVAYNCMILAVGAIMATVQWLSCHLAVFDKTQLHIHHYQVGFLLSLMVTHPVIEGAFLGMMMHGLLHYGMDPWIENVITVHQRTAE